MSTLWMFTLAVLDHWAVLLTGGGVTALLTVVQYWRGKSFPWRFQKWVVGIFFIIACFLAWRDEYYRAQQLSNTNATLTGQLQERERRIDELRYRGGSEEDRKAIESLQAANSQLEAALQANQDALVALQKSMMPRRLSSEERRQLTEALAHHNGQQFGVISVTTGPGCQECMLYRNEIVQAIISVPGWQASGDIDMGIKPELTGIFIGVKDSKSQPPKAHMIAQILKAANLPFKLGTMDRLSLEDSILIISNKP